MSLIDNLSANETILSMPFEDLQAVACRYREYGQQLGAVEWAPYLLGDTEQYVACFDPLIKALIGICDRALRESKDLPRLIISRIYSLANSSPSRNGAPDLLPIPLTLSVDARDTVRSGDFQRGDAPLDQACVRRDLRGVRGPGRRP